MTPSSPRLLVVAVALLLGLSSSSPAQTVATDPVGFVTIALPAGSDTFVSVPLKRPQEYAGLVGAVEGSTITVAGTPGWTASQFVYAAGTQPKTYYAFIASGPKEGCFYTIVSSTATSVTLDLAGDDISTAVVATPTATKIQIIPYDTFATVFPNGQGIVGTTDHQAPQTQVFIPDQQTPGVNLPAAASYHYFTGANPGWRRSTATGVVANDDILYPDSYFIVRTKPGQASSLTMMGGVQMNTLQAPLNLLSATLSQDNPVAMPVATSLTLRQTNLFESGAFVGSATHALRGRNDELLIFDNAVVKYNKAAARTYYYFTGANPGWRLAGDMNTVRSDSDFAVTPTTALIVRKKATGATTSAFWKVKPPYVP